MSDSGSTVTAAPSSTSGVTSSDYSGTTVPLVLVSAYQDEKKRSKTEKLPDLPSHRFRYSVWHELSDTKVTGDQLRCPRIRDGPEEKEMMFYRLRDETNRSIHHTRRGRERKDYQTATENWENTEIANLSYQELQNEYQRENFLRVLRRLLHVEELILIEDNLVDVSSVSLPRCTHLNMSNNYIPSFKKIPKIPQIKTLILADNDIKHLKGLKALKKTPIESLNLQRNPVSFSLNYRQRVFSVLPQLKFLDGVPHQESDDIVEPQPKGDWEPVEGEETSCVIS